MMDEKENIKALVLKYCDIIGTQDEAEFRKLWTDNENMLICITNAFTPLDSICKDFLIGGIQAAYSVIKLVPDGIKVRLTDENHGIVLLKYHTECIKRDDGSDFGISGLETQVVTKVGGDWKYEHIHYSM